MYKQSVYKIQIGYMVCAGQQHGLFNKKKRNRGGERGGGGGGVLALALVLLVLLMARKAGLAVA